MPLQNEIVQEQESKINQIVSQQQKLKMQISQIEEEQQIQRRQIEAISLQQQNNSVLKPIISTSSFSHNCQESHTILGDSSLPEKTVKGKFLMLYFTVA
jgi:hypothetical protein